jgi:hypothetical protein
MKTVRAMVLSPILAIVAMAAASLPASAAPLDQAHFHDSGSEILDDVCGLTVRCATQDHKISRRVLGGVVLMVALICGCTTGSGTAHEQHVRLWPGQVVIRGRSHRGQAADDRPVGDGHGGRDRPRRRC